MSSSTQAKGLCVGPTQERLSDHAPFKGRNRPGRHSQPRKICRRDLIMNQGDLKGLFYDEVAKCNRCGFCLAVCPIYSVKGKESATPRGKNAIIRAVIEGKIGWTPEIEETLFRCTGCRLCTQTCFPAVETNQGVLAGRECLVDKKQYPKVIDRVVEARESHFNISDEPNEERIAWVEFMKNA